VQGVIPVRSTVAAAYCQESGPRWHLGRWVLAICCAAPVAGLAQQGAAGAADLRQQAAALEHGAGVARDIEGAIALYCQAARLGDAASAFDLGWMYANARGVARDDELAARFFRVAAAGGIAQAENMLHLLGDAPAALPECLMEPAPPPAIAETPPAVPAPAPLNAPKPIVDLVSKIAPEYRVSVPLVIAIIQAESNYDAVAVSPKNAQGLMQLIPETARRFRVKNPFDPVQNVRGGIAYLRWLLAYFEGEIPLVAAAYNAGEKSVERYGGIPPFAETQAYVRRIVASVGALAQPFDANVAQPSPVVRQYRGAAGK
jgi:soluble lytic murein transglycosylase-like protein